VLKNEDTVTGNVNPTCAFISFAGSPGDTDPKYSDIQGAREQIEEIAQSMGAAQFVAATNKRCKECPVKSSCPIKAEGRTVIE
jgi:hypothetical protein